MSTMYKCPSCGAPIAFNPTKQCFSCDFCLSQFSEQEIIDYFAKLEAKHNDKATDDRAVLKEDIKKLKESDRTNEAFNSYHCNSCGATVVTDELTSSTFCYYCHSPVVISERLAGDFLPVQLIPFQTTEKQAKEAFLAWVGKCSFFVPKDFTDEKHLEKMTGLYVPAWFADAHVAFDYSAKTRELRSWTTGKYRYTKTTIHKHYRKGTMFLDDMSVNAYNQIDTDLLNAIFPYPLHLMRAFAKPYLSGYFAYQYDIPEADAKKSMAATAYHNSLIKIRQSIPLPDLYDEEDSVDVQLEDMLFTLLPTWILTYNYKGKIYSFSMNACTAETAGELPLNKPKLFLTVALVGLVTFLLLLLGGYLIW